jgi:uncharacterized protein YndB with AHSA1/START domain
MEAGMPYAFTLTATIPASARKIYDAWLDSAAHTEMTGGEAAMSDEVGAQVVAWGGYITGRNLELVPGERIVQSWRTSEFTEQHEDSIITVTLEEVADGTLLTLTHSRVPDGQTSYEQGGWQQHYFEPMQEYFTKHVRSGRKSKAAAPNTKAKAKARAKTKSKSKRNTAGAKSKSAASKAKTRGKKKSKRTVAKAKPNRAKNAKRKMTAAKRRK